VKLIEYIGRNLKDDDVIDLLERHDMEVIYGFDRLHENSPDEYTSSAHDGGFELRFDDGQVLTTIFCYMEERDGFSPADPEVVGAQLFASAAEARAAGEKEGANCKHKSDVEFLGCRLSWVSFETGVHKMHYQYSENGLSMITLALLEAVV
jgi:hypothetical protein